MKRSLLFALIMILFLLSDASCRDKDETDEIIEEAPLSELETALEEYGLVDMEEYIPGIRVELMYSTTNNFIGMDVYGDMNRCYLRPEAALKLSNAYVLLQEERPGYSFVLYDGARPQSVQETMWDVVYGTEWQGYVANPSAGSMHSYGCAIDLSIMDENGVILDMGTPFDSFQDLAQPKYEDKYLASGELTVEQLSNRLLLRGTMEAAGFHYISNEWWHFNAFPRAEVKSRFELIDL